MHRYFKCLAVLRNYSEFSRRRMEGLRRMSYCSHFPLNLTLLLICLPCSPLPSEVTDRRIISGKNIIKQFATWQFYTYNVIILRTLKNWPVCQVQPRLRRVASSWAGQTWLAAEASWACLSQQEAAKEERFTEWVESTVGMPGHWSLWCFWKFVRNAGLWESVTCNFEQWVLWGWQMAENHRGTVEVWLTTYQPSSNHALLVIICLLWAWFWGGKTLFVYGNWF